MSKTSSRRHSHVQPLQEYLLVAGSCLLVLGIVAFLQPSFFSILSVAFNEVERMMLVILGAAFIALEKNTEKKIQEYFALVAGALGIVVGAAGLMVHLHIIGDVLHVAVASSMTSSIIFLFLGGWGVAAAAISEQHKK